MEKTPSRSRNHSMSVCRSTSKRQMCKTETDGFTARTVGRGNMQRMSNMTLSVSTFYGVTRVGLRERSR
jgi:hypothetical protein